jgi:hypothetical protein
MLMQCGIKLKCSSVKLGKGSFVRTSHQIFDYLARATQVQATFMVVTCWHIWEARNDARNCKGFQHPDRIVGKISAYVEDIVKFCFKPESAKRCDSPKTSRWIPQPISKVCVNVDAGVEQRMDWGAVIRDHAGFQKLACKEGIDGIVVPEVAEAMAIKRALLVTKTMVFTTLFWFLIAFRLSSAFVP